MFLRQRLRFCVSRIAATTTPQDKKEPHEQQSDFIAHYATEYAIVSSKIRKTLAAEGTSNPGKLLLPLLPNMSELTQTLVGKSTPQLIDYLSVVTLHHKHHQNYELRQYAFEIMSHMRFTSNEDESITTSQVVNFIDACAHYRKSLEANTPFSAAVECLVRKENNVLQSHLGPLAYASVVLGVTGAFPESLRSLAMMLDRLALKYASTLNPREIGTLLTSIHRLLGTIDTATVAACVQRAIALKSDFNARECGQLLFACSKIDTLQSCSKVELFESFVPQVVRSVRVAHSAADVSHTLSAFTRVGVLNPQICTVLGEALLQCHDRLKPYEAAMVLHAIALQRDMYPAAVRTVLLGNVVALFKRMNLGMLDIESLALVLEAVSVLKSTPDAVDGDDDFMFGVVSRVHEQMGEASLVPSLRKSLLKSSSQLLM
eukprot:PhF_6_TR40332/c0_g1_i2/m.59965